MMFIDANIFLELTLEDKRNDECEEFFLKIKKENLPFITSDFVFYTCLIQIENKLKSINDMENFIIFIDNLKSLNIISPSYEALYKTFNIMKKYNLDFDDALVVSTMIPLGVKQLISFDKHFDKVREIKRLEPVQFLKD